MQNPRFKLLSESNGPPSSDETYITFRVLHRFYDNSVRQEDLPPEDTDDDLIDVDSIDGWMSFSFYDDRGVSTRVQADDFESARRVYALIYDHEWDLLSEDPPRIAVTASRDDDQIRLTFDEAISVVDVQR